MRNDSRDLTGTVGRAASILFGLLLVERGVTAYFGALWGAAAALSLAILLFLGIWLWSRRGRNQD